MSGTLLFLMGLTGCIVLGTVIGILLFARNQSRFSRRIWFEVNSEFAINVANLLKYYKGMRRYEIPEYVELSKEKYMLSPEYVRFEIPVPLTFLEIVMQHLKNI